MHAVVRRAESVDQGRSDEIVADDAIRERVERLSRPGRGGRRVIERAAILAEGTGSAAILNWLAAASWEPEAAPASRSGGGGSGLHGMRGGSGRESAVRQGPRRYVSPPIHPA